MSSEKLPKKIRTIESRRIKLERLETMLHEQVATSGSNRVPENSKYPIFNYFMGNRQFPEDENEQTARFLDSINNGNWSDKIFDDESVEQIALQCFRKRLISRQQFLTVLERQQLSLDYPNGNLTVYHLLDEHNQYTPYAEKIYIPILNQDLMYREGLQMSDEEKENLRLFIAALPKSEQIVYTTDVEEKDIFYSAQGNGVAQHPNLQHNLISPLLIITVNVTVDKEARKIEKIEIISPSAGLVDALSLAHYGMKNYVPVIYCVDQLGTKDIEQGVRHHFRPGNVVFRHDPPHKNIHQDPTPTRFAVTMHDYYHSIVMSRIPVNIRKAFLYMIDIARVNFKSLSKSNAPLLTAEIWDLIDADFAAQKMNHNPKYFPEQLTTEQETKKYCFLLAATKIKVMFRGGNGKDESDNGYEKDISVIGIFVYIDMLQNESTWIQQYNIDPNCLVSPLKESYEFVKEVFKKYPGNLSDSDPLKKIFIIKMAERFYNSTQSLENLSAFLIAINGDYADKDLHKMVEFHRIRDKDASNRNCIVLKEKEGAEDAMKKFDKIIEIQMIYTEISREESQLDLAQIDDRFFRLNDLKVQLIILRMANKFLSSSETDKNKLNSFLSEVAAHCFENGVDSIYSLEEKKSCIVLRINDNFSKFEAMMEKFPKPTPSYCVIL